MVCRGGLKQKASCRPPGGRGVKSSLCSRRTLLFHERYIYVPVEVGLTVFIYMPGGRGKGHTLKEELRGTYFELGIILWRVSASR